MVDERIYGFLVQGVIWGSKVHQVNAVSYDWSQIEIDAPLPKFRDDRIFRSTCAPGSRIM
jgi:hypothetical protein